MWYITFVFPNFYSILLNLHFKAYCYQIEKFNANPFKTLGILGWYFIKMERIE